MIYNLFVNKEALLAAAVTLVIVAGALALSFGGGKSPLQAEKAVAALSSSKKVYAPRAYKKVPLKLIDSYVWDKKFSVDARLWPNVMYVHRKYNLLLFAGRGMLSGQGSQIWFECNHRVGDKVCQKRIRRAARALRKSPAILYARSDPGTLAVAWDTSCGWPNRLKLVPPCRWVKVFMF